MTATAAAVTLQQGHADQPLLADTSDAAAPSLDPNLVNAWGLAFNPAGLAWISDNGTGLAALCQTTASAVPDVLLVVPGSRCPTAAADCHSAASTVKRLQPAADRADLQRQRHARPTPARHERLHRRRLRSSRPKTARSAAGRPRSAEQTKATPRGVDPSATERRLLKGLVDRSLSTPPGAACGGLPQRHDRRLRHELRLPSPPPLARGRIRASPAGLQPQANIYATPRTKGLNVAYAKQDDRRRRTTTWAGDGNGAISAFDLTGTLVESLVKAAPSATNLLNSPWALNTVPAGGWGAIPAGSLLVGNFGDGAIHAFNATTGAAVATFTTSAGPLLIDGLWSLAWGPSTLQRADRRDDADDQLYLHLGSS